MSTTLPTSYPPLYRLSVEKYHQIAQAGILGEDDNVELLEGFLVPREPKSPPEAACLSLLGRRLVRSLEDKCVRIRCAITLSDSEPEPDLAIAEGHPRSYVKAHPGPDDLYLVGEVADSHRDVDRVHRLRVYARARIPVYWIVNLLDNWIEVYTQPYAGRNPAYLNRQDYGPGQKIPIVIGGREAFRLAVRDLLL